MRVVPVVVAHVYVENAFVELGSESADHLLLADFSVDALVDDMELDETRANFDHHGNVLQERSKTCGHLFLELRR